MEKKKITQEFTKMNADRSCGAFFKEERGAYEAPFEGEIMESWDQNRNLWQNLLMLIIMISKANIY